MSQPWKLLPLAAALAVIGALLLAPGGVTRPHIASAELSCDEGLEGTLVINIIDDNTDDPLAVAGTIVEVTPDPEDGVGSESYSDNGPNDQDDDTGVIVIDDVCADDGEGDRAEYTVDLILLPGDLDEDCDVNTGSDENFAPEDNDDATFELEVDCDLATPTATATATTTVGPADKVTLNASPSSVGCTGTSIVTIQIRDEDDDPVAPGTAVTLSTTLGELSQTSGLTTDASGNAFVFLEAKGQGGTAVVTAKSGDAQGTANVTINCGATPTATSAPPATVAPGGGGVISPPNTGDAGLADTSGGTWTTFAGIGLLVVAATLGAAGIAKARA